MTLKPPMTTYGRSAAVASAPTPSRSGPESSSRGMAGLDRGDEDGDRLLGELLAEGDALVHRQRGGEFRFLARLFLVDLRPLSLVAGAKERVVRARSHG